MLAHLAKEKSFDSAAAREGWRVQNEAGGGQISYTEKIPIKRKAEFPLV